MGLTRLGDGAVGKLGSGNLVPWKLMVGDVVTVEKSLMIWFSLVVELVEPVVDPVVVEVEGAEPGFKTPVMVMPPPIGPGMTVEIGVTTTVPMSILPKFPELPPFPVTILLDESVTELPLMVIVDDWLEEPLTDPPIMLELIGPPATLTPEAVLVLVETVAREVEEIKIPRFTIRSAICPAASVARTRRM